MFLDLASTMDHKLSQQYQTYQLEDVWIWAGESPDELIDHLHGLTEHSHFPTEEQKERNV